MADRDYYAALGLARGASAEEIQRAYRKLARTYHPDVNKDPGAEDRFKEVSEAYDVLSDPETRRRYDAFGPQFRQVPEGVDPETWARGQQGGTSRRGTSTTGSGRPGASGFTWSTSGDDDDLFTTGFGDLDVEDLFDGFFTRGRAGGGGRRRPARGGDAETEVPISVEEAF